MMPPMVWNWRQIYTMAGDAKPETARCSLEVRPAFRAFIPTAYKDNPYIPPVVITSFKKFDKPYPLSGEIALPYNENFISFEFAALSYISPERNQYAYKMEGVDEVWVNAGTRRYASYPNLDPGEYVFRVKGSNNEGIWNEAGTSIAIVISPPWWKTVWAYGFYALSVFERGLLCLEIAGEANSDAS